MQPLPPRHARGVLFSQRRRKLRLLAPRPLPPPTWRRLNLTELTVAQSRPAEVVLVLSARNIPWRIARIRGSEQIYVPALLERQALYELECYAAENSPPAKHGPVWPLHGHWLLAPLYLIPLAFIYVQEAQPGAAGLEAQGALDAIRCLLYGEWWRPITALWLHVGLMHLVGNLFFGSLFLCLLARLCGTGHAWLITLAAGSAGNALSVFAHRPGYTSIGFSTAIFAALGAVAGLLVWRAPERFLLPLAAALGLLAMLGVEGANTDYGAHLCGLAAGLVAGLGEGWALVRHLPLPSQFAAAGIALAVPACAWQFALAQGG